MAVLVELLEAGTWRRRLEGEHTVRNDYDTQASRNFRMLFR